MVGNEHGNSESRAEGDAGRNYELLAVSRVSAALSGLSDLDAILKMALDNVLTILNGNIGGILLLDEATQTLYYHVHQGLSEKYVAEVHLKPGEGILGQTAQSGKAILLETSPRTLE